MKTIAIIGGGWSGMLTAIQLLEKSKNIHVKVIHSEQSIGLGSAYSTTDEAHLLNVPAGKMSAFQKNPSHFIDWLKNNGYSSENIEAQFFPRYIYGKYITELVDYHKKNKLLEFIHAKAIDITKQESAYRVLLSNSNSIRADKIVLALGNFLPANPKSKSTSFHLSSSYFQNPWHTGYLKNLDLNKDVLIIGTGLTMIDSVLSLKKNGLKGKIFVVSPRGYTSAAHSKQITYPNFYHELKGKSLLEIFQIVRRHLKFAETKNSSWQGVIDSLRPHSQQIWIALSKKEKQQFISHIRHIWGIARHRLPLTTYNEITILKKKEQLEIIGGRIIDMQEKNGNVSIAINLRKNSAIRELVVSRVINCTGPQNNYAELTDELVQRLLSKKMILADDLKMGIKTTLNGNVLEKDEHISSDIFAIGSLLRGVLWETTAVPEIRVQAENIAMQIIDSIE